MESDARDMTTPPDAARDDPDPTRLLSVEDCARVLGASRTKVLDLVNSGDLRAWRTAVGGLRISDQDVTRHLDLESVEPGFLTTSDDIEEVVQASTRELVLEAWAMGETPRGARWAGAVALLVLLLPLTGLTLLPASFVDPNHRSSVILPISIVGLPTSVLLSVVIVVTFDLSEAEWSYVRRAAGRGFIGTCIVSAVGAVLAYFAFFYYVLSQYRPDSFGEPLSKVDSLYLSTTIFTTTGFGDIAPASPAARSLVMLQMLFGFAVISVIVATLVARAADRD